MLFSRCESAGSGSGAIGCRPLKRARVFLYAYPALTRWANEFRRYAAVGWRRVSKFEVGQVSAAGEDAAGSINETRTASHPTLAKCARLEWGTRRNWVSPAEAGSGFLTRLPNAYALG